VKVSKRRIVEIRSVTLVAPMRNERRHVGNFVADVAAQDYSGALDVIVADGRSDDGSVEALESAGRRAGIRLRVIDNPGIYVSAALNRCIAASTGDLVVRLDLHTRYPPGYVRMLVETAEVTGAWNVGGITSPLGITPTERAVAAAMDSPFGGIGWTRAAGAERPVEVDTVPFGAFPRRVFEVVGGFDEELVRNQDDDFNLRLRLAGGTIVLDPRIRVGYIPRGSLDGLFRQYFEYGRWKIPVMRKHHRVLSGRSLMPAVFVVGLVVTATAAAALPAARWMLGAEATLYAVSATAFGVQSLRARAEPMSSLPRVVAAFGALHVGYGLGMLRGLAA
jgi:succinoglycan biosynthesis protein ExoA